MDFMVRIIYSMKDDLRLRIKTAESELIHPKIYIRIEIL